MSECRVYARTERGNPSSSRPKRGVCWVLSICSDLLLLAGPSCRSFLLLLASIFSCFFSVSHLPCFFLLCLLFPSLCLSVSHRQLLVVGIRGTGWWQILISIANSLFDMLAKSSQPPSAPHSWKAARMSNPSLHTRNNISSKQNPLGLIYFTKRKDLQLPKRASCVNHCHEGAASCKAGLNL